MIFYSSVDLLVISGNWGGGGYSNIKAVQNTHIKHYTQLIKTYWIFFSTQVEVHKTPTPVLCLGLSQIGLSV